MEFVSTSSSEEFREIAQEAYDKMAEHIQEQALHLADRTGELQVPLGILVEVLLAHVVNVYGNVAHLFNIEPYDRAALRERLSKIASNEMRALFNRHTGMEN